MNCGARDATQEEEAEGYEKDEDEDEEGTGQFNRCQHLYGTEEALEHEKFIQGTTGT